MARHPHPAGKPPSQRQLRVAELVRRALSDTLLRGDIHDPDLNRVSVTVGEVRMSPDLRHATAFVLPLGGDDVEGLLAALNRNKGEIRHQVSRAVTLKYSPDFRFLADKSFDQMDETRKLLSSQAVKQDLGETS